MASNRDILDAQRFNKRRLISAFTSGTPGGREVELASPWGPLIFGLVLTIALLIGGWLFGRFVPTLPQNWENGTYIVDSDNGSRYYSVDGVLHPMTNTASARLLQGGGNLSNTVVGSSALEDIPRGRPIGIPEAPDSLPEPEQLINSGWIACATVSGNHVELSTNHQAQDNAGALVSFENETFLVAEGRRHHIPQDHQRAVLVGLGWENHPITEVDASWLNLFDQGSELQPLQIPQAGESLDELPANLQGATVGTIVTVPETDGERRYVLLEDKSLAPLSNMAHPMLLIGSATESSEERRVSVSDIAQLTVTEKGPEPTDWPATQPQVFDEEYPPCAVSITVDGNTTTALAQHNQDSLTPETTVTGGTGSLVRATSGGTLGSVYLITDTGLAYGLGGNTLETVQSLGYEESMISNVPAAWVELFEDGPELSPEAAWSTVPQSSGDGQ